MWEEDGKYYAVVPRKEGGKPRKILGSRILIEKNLIVTYVRYVTTERTFFIP
jgi:hypothetical protein